MNSLDTTRLVLSFLDDVELLNKELVCKTWQHSCKSQYDAKYGADKWSKVKQIHLFKFPHIKTFDNGEKNNSMTTCQEQMPYEAIRKNLEMVLKLIPNDQKVKLALLLLDATIDVAYSHKEIRKFVFHNDDADAWDVDVGASEWSHGWDSGCTK